MPRFIKNGPIVPDQLVQELEEDRVIIFCGAGISAGGGLPNFRQLVEYCYTELGATAPPAKDLAWNWLDRMLGALEGDFPDQMRTKVVEALDKAATDLTMHDAVLKLARLKGSANGYRLVTTNFDLFFEQANPKLALGIDYHSGPVLTIPRNDRIASWRSIVYLHGRLNRGSADNQHLVLTSADFGRAYLTDAWAARFVARLYLRDERPHAGPAPPAVLYRYTPDRKGEHPQRELAGFRGHLHADGYGGFDALYEAKGGGSAAVTEVACMAHVRRKFFDEHAETGSPLAAEALKRIGVLFDIERALAGQPAEERRQVRQAKARPLLDELAAILDTTLVRIPGKGDLAKAIRYARSRWTALTRYVDDGRLEISNNAAERAIRPLAIGRRNWMFAGSDAGGERAAAIYTLVETAKLNGLDPQAYLRDVLGRIADHPINRIADLLPWNIAAAASV
ncbi:Mobile element protein [Azospirillum argentinense]